MGSNRKLKKRLSFLYPIKPRDLSVKMDRVCWASWISPLAGVIISPLCQALPVRACDVWLKDCHKIAPHSFLWGIDRRRERRGFESPINIVTSIVASCFVGDCGEHCLLNCEHFPLHSTSYLFEWPKVPISMIKKIENFTQHGDGIQRLSFCV